MGVPCRVNVVIQPLGGFAIVWPVVTGVEGTVPGGLGALDELSGKRSWTLDKAVAGVVGLVR